jgi:DNA-binding CsgD family transcriptional regulator
VVAKLYGLTRSELRVLLAMSPGLCVREAAEMLGISVVTAKTHLHSIYAKTGISKQTGLMRLLMGSTPPVSGSAKTTAVIGQSRNRAHNPKVIRTSRSAEAAATLAR